MSRRKAYWSYSLMLLVLIFFLTACDPTPSGPTPTPNPVFNPGCSTSNLIAHIGQANSNPGPDVINLDPYCIYPLTHIDNDVIVDSVRINNGFPGIIEDLTIQGNNAVIEITPDPSEDYFGHFYVAPTVELTLYDLTLRGGFRMFGGAVVNEGGDFIASHVLFENNESQQEGNLPSKGGAIYNLGGNVSVINGTHFERNQAGSSVGVNPSQGGAIYSLNGTLEVYHTSFIENSVAGSGGAIYSEKDQANPAGGLVTISDSLFFDNDALRDGGAIALINEIEGVFISSTDFSENLAPVGNGGAIYSRGTDLNGFRNEFIHNRAVNGGGVFTELEWEGPMSSYHSDSARYNLNDALDGGGIFSEHSELTVEDGNFIENEGNSCGAIHIGGFFGLDVIAAESDTTTRGPSTARIIDTNFHYNTAVLESGGAICHVSGDLTIQDSTFTSNSAEEGGGGLITFDQTDINGVSFFLNSAELGGGIVVGYPLRYFPEDYWVSQHYMTFNTTISGSSFIANEASLEGGGIYGQHRGALIISKTYFRSNISSYFGGAIRLEEGDTYLRNTSFGMNSASRGGGIYAFDSPSSSNSILMINHATFAGNIALETSNGGDWNNKRWGGGGLNVGGKAVVENSIFANNSSMDCQLDNGMNYSAPGTYSTDHTCAGLIEPDPKLGPFVDNGGGTLTFPLLSISPLIDVLPNCGLPDDQRGVTRHKGAACDPGAYEFDPENPLDMGEIIGEPERISLEPDDCDPFGGVEYSLVILNVAPGSTDLTLYLKVVGGVEAALPAIQAGEIKEIITAMLGETEANLCNMQGFDDRIYCMFTLPPSMLGTVQELKFLQPDCEDPVLLLPAVSIPTPSLVCKENLSEDDCEAAGGHMSSGVTTAPKCVCP